MLEFDRSILNGEDVRFCVSRMQLMNAARVVDLPIRLDLCIAPSHDASE